MNIIQSIDGFIRDFPQYSALKDHIVREVEPVGALDAPDGLKLYFQHDLLSSCEKDSGPLASLARRVASDVGEALSPTTTPELQAQIDETVATIRDRAPHLLTSSS